MSLDNFSSNKTVINGLTNSIINNTLSHAYIIEGDDGKERIQFAKEYAKAILCEELKGKGCDRCLICRKIEHDNHEDLFYLEQSNKTGYSVQDIKLLSEKLSMMPSLGGRNIAVIDEADRISAIGQNKLLKLLEEPYPGTIILLLTSNRENLLDTVKSRCVAVNLGDGNQATGRQKEKATEVLNMIDNSEYYHVFREYIAKYIKSFDDAVVLLDELEKLMRDRLIDDRENKYYIDAIMMIEETRTDIIRGMNKTSALKKMYLILGGK